MSTQLPERVGRYEVVERLGTGGMGVVYLATDPLLRRTVAVKVLPSESEELRERFAREGRSAAALRHNNIVTIYDVGDDNGQPFIAMEFLDGESMAEMIRRRAPLTVPRRLQLLVELCAGLGYAHRNGIVHRDIKPANLMITSEGGLKVLDFGLARVISEPTLGALTGVATLLGTPHYLAPEQIAGTTGDKTSDIFAVGLVLYEFLSYRKAFPGESGPAILFDIVEKEPTPIRELVPDIDDELETIVAKAIEKDRARRYADLEVLGEALEHVRVRLARSPDDSGLPRRHKQKPRLPAIAKSADAASSPGDQRLDAIAQKRALKIAEHLAAATAELQAGQYERVIEHCEHALLLDADDEQGLELLLQAHRGIEDAQVQGWVDKAKDLLSNDVLTEAEQLIEQSLRIRADRPDLLSLLSELKERHRERERQAEQQRSALAALERANRNMAQGALEAVVRSATEALAYDPEHAEARELRARAIAMIEERQRQQERADAGQPELQRPGKEPDKQRDEGAQAEPLAMDDRAEPVQTAVSQITPALDSTWTRPALHGPASLSRLRPMHLRLLMAAAVLVVAIVGAWLARSQSAATTPAPLAPEAPVTPPPVSAERLVAEQNAERYRQLLQQAEERLAATDADGAAAAIQQAAKILGGDPRLDELQKRVDSVRADTARAQQQQADIDVALGQAAKLISDTEAIARLQRELARYPGTAAIAEAIAARTQARDGKIADRLRRAQSAPDEQAVTLLQEALAFNPARLDVRRELDRRRASMTAAAAKARNPRPSGSREEVEDEVRRTLYAYQSAYASRSVEEFLKVAPFRTRAQIEAEFSRFRSIQLNIEGVTIDLDESATRATITCTISTVFVPFGPNAKAMMDKRAWQFLLTYAGGAWQITRARSR